MIQNFRVCVSSYFVTFGKTGFDFSFVKLEGKLIKGISVCATDLDDRLLSLLKRKHNDTSAGGFMEP